MIDEISSGLKPCLGVFTVLIPLPNTVWRRDLDENILVSMENGSGVKVFCWIEGDKNKSPRNR